MGALANLDSNMPNKRHPILMTKTMPLAHEMIKLHHEEHLKHCGGHRHLLTNVRDKFWIENGLVLAKRVIKNCARCQKRNARAILHPTAPLHISRYQTTRTFSSLGVDMFGPMDVKRGRGKTREKRYGIIFACTFTRAINIEVAHDASAQACLLAFRRHSASYGQPTKINSDRGTNFQTVKGLVEDIQTAWVDSQPLIRNHFPEIQWTMNPPRTPSFGGHFESLIRTIKTMFKELTKDSKYSLTDDELNTCLKEAAAIANMRPLTELSEDPQDDQPIRPSDFLNAPILGSTPDWTNATMSKHVKTEVERFKQELWEKMRKAVLKNCQRLKSGKKGQPLMEGDLVLVRTQDWRPDHWPLARVIRVLPGQDKETRVIEIKHLHKGEAGDTIKETVQSTRNLFRINLPAQTPTERMLRSGKNIETEITQKSSSKIPAKKVAVRND